MKKLLLLTSIVLLSTTLSIEAATVNSVTTTKQSVQKGNQNFDMHRPPEADFKGPRPLKGPEFKKRNAEFEKRLNLTDEQKNKAEQMRKDGFEKMKPIMDKIHEKQKTLNSLKGQDGQNEKIEQLHKELSVLKKEAHEMRMQNMKEFESILDKNQQKELKNIKEEGRKKFEEMNKQRTQNGMPPKPPKDME